MNAGAHVVTWDETIFFCFIMLLLAGVFVLWLRLRLMDFTDRRAEERLDRLEKERWEHRRPEDFEQVLRRLAESEARAWDAIREAAKSNREAK
jgi:hypothetical protein